MKKPVSLLLAAAMFAGLMTGTAAVSANTVQAADYPTKAVTMIVPYGAGGTTDLVGRQLAIALEKQLGQSIVVENMSGASGSVGSQSCLDADPDGYTVLFTAETLGTQRVMGISELSYNDFEPIVAVANDPKVIVVAKDSKYNTIEELLEDIKANPNTIQMSYTGPGGSGHVQALILNQFGYEPALTAYASGAEGITAVLGNQVVFTNSNFATVKDYLESGDLKALAVCSTNPIETYPDIPTLASAIEGSEELMSIPYTPLSLVVDKDVPEEVREVLRSAALEAVKDPDFDKFMTDSSIDKLYEQYTTIEDIKAFYAQWESTVSWLLYDAGAAINSPEDFEIPRP